MSNDRRDEPLVSVATPVYNGAQHLRECVQSVLDQTYSNWEYTIVNNCSTDDTLAIAEEFAKKHDQIKVHNNSEFLDVVASHNKAFSLVSPDSQYFKLVNADDWLFPNCISEMVALARQHPSIGMVSSYVLSGSDIGYAGLSHPSHLVSGREICRRRFLEDLKVFGGPSASLIRSDILRRQVPFYNPTNYHGDNEAYLQLLKDDDFGFVHQVLTYRRRGEDSRTTHYLARVQSYLLGDLEELLAFGEYYLTPEELEEAMRGKTRAYYRLLAQAVIERRGSEFWEYHRKRSSRLGIPISNARLSAYVLLKLLDLALNPKRTIESAWARLRS